MIGVVLCGGLSTRMHTDKGLLTRHDGETWAEHGFALLTQAGVPVFISINEAQVAHYSCLFDAKNIIVDDPDLQLKGPLLGLISAHLRYPCDDILVLPCDMAGMQVAVLREFWLWLSLQPAHDAYVYSDDDTVQPLCALYTAGALRKLNALNKQGLLHKHSLKYCLSLLNVFASPIPVEWKSYFANFNSPEDIRNCHKALL